MQRVALIAGGTGDIGQAICRELHATGTRVAVGYATSATSRDQAEALASSFGDTAIAIALRANEDPTDSVRRVHAHYGRLDILVNASGINLEDSAPAMRLEDWQKVIDINLSFALRLTQAAMPHMLPARYGRIVHLSSIAARAGGRGQIAYAVAKAGLERMIRVFALEVGRKGITINGVSPGVILSSMSKRVREAHEKELLNHIASRRFGTPEDIAHAVAFLTSEAAGYINGAILPVDGGMLL